jgi:hypothetical protein
MCMCLLGPQRVCSCPLLFLVYINDIDDKLLSLSRLFADDLRKTHMCLETLFIKFYTCLFHFASSLNVIPTFLWSDVSGINFPSK